MMHLNFGSYVPESMPPPYPFDDSEAACHTRMTLSQVTQRLSRGTTTRPRAESSSRVSKPNSASTSPGLSKMARRRTMASESLSTRRHEQAMKYIAATLGLGEEQFHAQEGQQQQQQQQQEQQQQQHDYHPRHHQQARPVSWHPSTQISSTHFQQQPSSFPTPHTYFQQPDFYSPASHYSPEMTSTFSSNPSPTSTFSTLPLPYGCVDNMAQMPADGWHYGDRSSLYPSMNDSLYAGEPCATFNGLIGSPSGLDWNGFVMQGYNTTSPPTPDTFLTAMTTTQLPQPAITEAYYQTPDEPEDEGEILVGMGLYDDKREEDPQLNNYRYTVSTLLGTTFRPQEPRGKGLKLEETWEPPKSDDEEDEEEEEESED